MWSRVITLSLLAASACLDARPAGAEPAVGLLPHRTVVKPKTGPGDALRTLTIATTQLTGDSTSVVSGPVRDTLQKLPLVIAAVCELRDGKHQLVKIGLGYGIASADGEVQILLADQLAPRHFAGTDRWPSFDPTAIASGTIHRSRPNHPNGDVRGRCDGPPGSRSVQ